MCCGTILTSAPSFLAPPERAWLICTASWFARVFVRWCCPGSRAGGTQSRAGRPARGRGADPGGHQCGGTRTGSARGGSGRARGSSAQRRGAHHRSGRTGRAGRKGTSVLIASLAERRKAERLLANARVEFSWANVPGPRRSGPRAKESGRYAARRSRDRSLGRGPGHGRAARPGHQVGPAALAAP